MILDCDGLLRLSGRGNLKYNRYRSPQKSRSNLWVSSQSLHWEHNCLMAEAGAEVRVASCGLGLFRAFRAHYVLYVIRTRTEFKQHKRRKKWRVFLHSLNFVPVFRYCLLHIPDVDDTNPMQPKSCDKCLRTYTPMQYFERGSKLRLLAVLCPFW